MGRCLICESIEGIKNGTNPHFVAELKTGYVVIGYSQFFKGYALFMCKEHCAELHELKSDFRWQFLKEMSLVAEAIYRAFKPRKMNYELLGNAEEHLHWHLFPRYADDLRPREPVWVIDVSIRDAKSEYPSPERLQKVKEMLLKELSAVPS